MNDYTGPIFAFPNLQLAVASVRLPVLTVTQHPSLDVALLFTPKQAGVKRGIRRCAEEQPAGQYFLAHHAGGLPLQISTGEIPDYSGVGFVLEHHLLADAGPLASGAGVFNDNCDCLLYTSPSPRDATLSRMPSSA